MQYSADQPNNYTRFSSTRPHSGGRRGTTTPRYRGRKVARLADRMGQPIRAPRVGTTRTPFLNRSTPGPEFFRPETKPTFRPASPAGDQISKVVCHKSPASAAFSRKVSASGDLGDCVVADAVTVEPVSIVKFPANREKNREFHQISPPSKILKANPRANSKASSKISYATEQGIISAEQGILFQEQGIFAGQIRNHHRMRFSVHRQRLQLPVRQLR